MNNEVELTKEQKDAFVLNLISFIESGREMIDAMGFAAEASGNFQCKKIVDHFLKNVDGLINGTKEYYGIK